MSQEIPENDLVNDLPDLPAIPEVIRNDPRKMTTIIGIVLVAFSFLISLTFAFVFNELYIKKDGGARTGALSWFPGNFIVEIIIFWTFPFLFLLLSILFVRFLSIFYIYLHKAAKFGKYKYSLISMDATLIEFPEVLGRAIVPFLLSFSIGYWFSNWFFGETVGDTVSVLLLFLYAIMFSPITVIVVTPLWLLDDAGIISIRKRSEGERKLPDIQGPSTYFVSLLTGSAYSLALVTFITFIIAIIQSTGQVAFLGALVYIVIMFYIEWIALIYLFEIFIHKLKFKLLEKIPEKLVDTTPKVLTDEKSVAVLKSIGEIIHND